MNLLKYYEDIKVTDVNTEPLRSYYIPTSKSQDLSWKDRTETDRFFLLNGEWDFKYFPCIYDLEDDFFEVGYNTASFDKINVPSVWQCLGYDQPQYTNTRYPFPFDPPYVPLENPCGAYVKKFNYEKANENDSFYLNFEGVDSCLYLWVNGEFVGYHQVSHSTAEFDITKLLRNGENTVACLVLKWCDGSYLEDQDKFRSSGIFRDVYIIERPTEHIRDFFVKTNLVKNYTKAEVKIELALSNEFIPVTAKLCDQSGNVVATAEAVPCDGEGFSKNPRLETETYGIINFDVENITTWNAENPVLYTLTLETADEVIREKVGFREIMIRDCVVYLNGQKVRFRGTNRHDSDPYVGPAVNLEHIRRDMALMKQHNFNAIRTSHYPNCPQFYEMCDEYGFYVIDETDIEIHGVVDLYDLNIWNEGPKHPFTPFICDNPEWVDAIVDRVQKNLLRDKNRPCVVIWSMGNEAGYGITFETALKWTKSYDRSRLSHYEGSMHAPRHPYGGKNDYSNIDLRSRMYASIPEMHAYLQNSPDKPFIQCEFVHAMGNGPGDIEDYYLLEEQYDSYVGGFVWEWCDHGVYMGQTEDGKPKFGYGGDSGEFPHDSNFCMDGLVKPDRTPSTGLKEYKNVHRPMRVKLLAIDTDDDVRSVTVFIQNKLDFTNLSDLLYLVCHFYCDGEKVAEIVVDDPKKLNVAPRSEKLLTIKVPKECRFTPEDEFEGSCSISITSYLKKDLPFREKGFELGFDQIMLKDGFTEKLQTLMENEDKSALSIKETGKTYEITGEGFTYTYNKLTGLFNQLKKGDKEYLNHPMELNIWRAPTDNDRIVKRLWYEAGYDMMQTRTYSNEIKCEEDGSVVIRTTSSMAPVYRQKFLDFVTVWTVLTDGTIHAEFEVEWNSVKRGPLHGYFNHPEQTERDPFEIENSFEIKEAFLPRLGVRLFLDKELKNAEYYGYGPYESYVDKHQASWIGKFKSTAADLYEEYIRPQENGNHYHCEYIEVAAEDGRSFTAYSEQRFDFNLSEYTQEELTKKAHNFELEKADSTILCVDYAQSGIGSGSCGPQLAKKYRLNDRNYSYEFYFKLA